MKRLVINGVSNLDDSERWAFAFETSDGEIRNEIIYGNNRADALNKLLKKFGNNIRIVAANNTTHSQGYKSPFRLNGAMSDRVTELELEIERLTDKILDIKSEGLYRGRATTSIIRPYQKQLDELKANLKLLKQKRNGIPANIKRCKKAVEDYEREYEKPTITDYRSNPEKKRFSYKGFTCIWKERLQGYEIFTKDEMEYPANMRSAEMDCETEQQCKDFIDSY